MLTRVFWLVAAARGEGEYIPAVDRAIEEYVDQLTCPGKFGFPVEPVLYGFLSLVCIDLAIIFVNKVF